MFVLVLRRILVSVRTHTTGSECRPAQVAAVFLRFSRRPRCRCLAWPLSTSVSLSSPALSMLEFTEFILYLGEKHTTNICLVTIKCLEKNAAAAVFLGTVSQLTICCTAAASLRLSPLSSVLGLFFHKSNVSYLVTKPPKTQLLTSCSLNVHRHEPFHFLLFDY